MANYVTMKATAKLNLESLLSKQGQKEEQKKLDNQTEKEKK